MEPFGSGRGCNWIVRLAGLNLVFVGLTTLQSQPTLALVGIAIGVFLIVSKAGKRD